MSQQTFGQWIKQRCNILDLTQEQLAGLVGCAPETIRQRESQRRRPSRQLAELLAARLQLPSDERAAFIALGRQSAASPAAPALAHPAQPALAAPQSAVPAALTPLIGREYDLRRLGERLGQPAVRLLTLLGPGGIGKTRLALAAAALAPRFSAGAVFVPLADLVASALVVPAIAQALGLVETTQAAVRRSVSARSRAVSSC